MPPALVDSQFADLQPPTQAEAHELGYTLIRADADTPTDQLAAHIAATLANHRTV